MGLAGHERPHTVILTISKLMFSDDSVHMIKDTHKILSQVNFKDSIEQEIEYSSSPSWSIHGTFVVLEKKRFLFIRDSIRLLSFLQFISEPKQVHKPLEKVESFEFIMKQPLTGIYF